jgi:hypothetical protein
MYYLDISLAKLLIFKLNHKINPIINFFTFQIIWNLNMINLIYEIVNFILKIIQMMNFKMFKHSIQIMISK